MRVVTIKDMHYHVTEAENLASIMRDGLMPSIGARSKALGETCEVIYFFPTEEDMDNALSNWLGEEFEDVEIAILAVASDSIVEGDVPYEHVSETAIAPECITVVSIE